MTRRAPFSGLSVLLLILLVHPVHPAPADQAVPEGAVEAVAAGILGNGALRLAFVTGRGHVVLRWESPSYTPTDDEGRARVTLRSEASRVTGELLSAFSWISAIHFTITYHGAVLATGEYLRGEAMTIFYASRAL